MLPDYLIDLHIHPSLKPRHFIPSKSIWEFLRETSACQNLPPFMGGITREIETESQTNLDRCAQAKARGLVLALYPPERGIFDLRDLTNLILIRMLSSQKKKINLGVCLSGFEPNFVDFYLNQVEHNLPVHYFDELRNEYHYLLHQESANQGKPAFKVVGDYAEFKATLEKPGAMAAILSIEGLHSVLNFKSYSQIKSSIAFVNQARNLEYQFYWKQIQSHVQEMRTWGGGRHCPFFITFSHHFWNLMGGHSHSFQGVLRTFGVNQRLGINTGMSHLGREVLDLLLDNSQGRRILIDTKHMSVALRQDFYKVWEEYAARGDNFPIISSHSAVSGIKSLSDRRHRRDSQGEIKNQYFNTWSINLCDEDILYVLRSGGIIGLVLHEGRMPGGISNKILKYYRRRNDKDGQRTEYVRLFMANVFHIVRVCHQNLARGKEAWEIIALGSDLDGLINSFDCYSGAEDLRRFATDVLQFLYRPIDNPHAGLFKKDYQELSFGFRPEEIVQKIFTRNAENFLRKYFNDEYLISGNPNIAINQ